MQRERGKVPTKINKDSVATGAVETKTQIINAGSQSARNLAQSRLKESGGKNTLDLELAAFKKSKIEIKPAVEQKPKEFTKRIEHARSKD